MQYHAMQCNTTRYNRAWLQSAKQSYSNHLSKPIHATRSEGFDPQYQTRREYDGGFFHAGEELRGMFDNSFPAKAFFFKVEISSRTLIPLFRPGSVHSGSANWDDCDFVFPD